MVLAVSLSELMCFTIESVCHEYELSRQVRNNAENGVDLRSKMTPTKKVWMTHQSN